MLRAYRGQVDKVLLFCFLLICFFGIVFIYSATWDLWDSGIEFGDHVVKQGMWVIAGLIFMFVIMNMDYIKLMDFAYLAYAVNLLALVFLLLFGGEHYGARRWIDLGPVSLQPSEFVKITFILALAAFLGERREQIGTLKNFIGAVLLIMPAAALIFLQPDLGTAFVLVPILFSILFVCGERVKYMAITIAMGLASIPFYWILWKDYKKTRLM